MSGELEMRMALAEHNQNFDGVTKRIYRYIFNDSKSAGLKPDRND